TGATAINCGANGSGLHVFSHPFDVHLHVKPQQTAEALATEGESRFPKLYFQVSKTAIMGTSLRCTFNSSKAGRCRGAVSKKARFCSCRTLCPGCRPGGVFPMS
ncbi:hypothetical protein CSUI_010981, partial [Cystoisospora suis]